MLQSHRPPQPPEHRLARMSDGLLSDRLRAARDCDEPRQERLPRPQDSLDQPECLAANLLALLRLGDVQTAKEDDAANPFGDRTQSWDELNTLSPLPQN